MRMWAPGGLQVSAESHGQRQEASPRQGHRRGDENVRAQGGEGDLGRLVVSCVTRDAGEERRTASRNNSEVMQEIGRPLRHEGRRRRGTDRVRKQFRGDVTRWGDENGKAQGGGGGLKRLAVSCITRGAGEEQRTGRTEAGPVPKARLRPLTISCEGGHRVCRLEDLNEARDQ